MRSWRFAAPLVLVVLGVAVLAPLLLLRHSDDDVDARAGPRARGPASTGSASGPAAAPTIGVATPTAEAARSAIRTASSTYFGRPFETVQIVGHYGGARGPTSLRVEIQQPGGWTPLPLPAVTKASGDFTAYVEMGGPAIYMLRIVDPQRDTTSSVLELVVF